MKRLFSLLLLCALLSALAAPALADVAYIPTNSFLEQHQQECVYENRWYWTNGPLGYVHAHTAPASRESVPLPNGQRYLISCTYQGRWGLLEYDPETLGSLPWRGVSAWVFLHEMTPDYDNQAFLSDHADELVVPDELVELEADESKTVYLYRYPGSGNVVGEVDGSWLTTPIVFYSLFTDPAGRQWGACNYLFGYQDFWVCLDDPYNGALAPDENCVTIVTLSAPEPLSQTAAPAPTEAPEPTEAPAPTESPAPGKTIELTPVADEKTLEQAAREGRGNGPYIAAGAAAVVVVAAAVLIAVLRKKRK